MFKRLKDKITEEVKISPSKFSASVQQWQQMAQAVVSPNSNSVIDAPSMDSFSIDGDYDETPQNSPAHPSSRTSDRSTPTKSSIGDPSTFTLVDLQENSPTQVSGHASSRRSSFTSTTSDSPAILFPVLEMGTANHFQSDLESCSERDESLFSSNADNVSKEQLLSAFRKTQQRYYKYKGRYTDLMRHYRDLERENAKAKTVLSECQDKALRRAAELKEQCQLAQKAKAHLEENLRSDLEEKDHLIHTLQTKIQLLKTGVNSTEVLSESAQPGTNLNAMDLSGYPSNNEPLNNVRNTTLSESEMEAKFQEKVTKLEELLKKCKEVIHSKQERIGQLEKENESMTERETELQNKIKELQLREEETSLSVAENKMMVHQELESKEDVIRQLNKQLASANLKSADLQKEIEQLQDRFKKDLAVGKQEASRLIQAEMQQIVGANRKLEEELATRDQQLSEHKASLSSANQRLQELKEELGAVRDSKQLQANTEISALQATVAELELALERSDLSARLEPVLKPLREIKESAQQLRGELTESLKATKGYVEDSVQDIHSRSSQLLAESKQELQELREEREKSEAEMQSLREKIIEIESGLKEKEEKVTCIEGTVSAERKVNADLKKTLEELKRQSDECQRSLEEKLRKSELGVEQYKKELEQVRQGLLSAESSERKFIEELQEQIKRQEDEMNKLVEDSKLLEERLRREHSIVEELTVKANLLSSLEAQVESLKADNAQLLEDKNKEISEWENKYASLCTKVDLLTVDKNRLSEEIAKLEDVMVENEAIQLSETQKSETHLNEKNVENEELRNSLKNVQASFNSLKEEHSVIALKLEETEKKCNELKLEADAANAEVCEKQRLLNDMEAQFTSLSGCTSEITLLKEENRQLSETIALLESRLRLSSEELQDKEGLMEEKQVELGNLLNLKTQQLQELREELDVCKTELSNRSNLLELKTRECAGLVNQSSAFAYDLNTKSQDLLEKLGECEQLTTQIASIKRELENERERSEKILEEITTLKEEDRTLRQENQTLNEAKESLEIQMKVLSEEHANQAHLLKVKTEECAEKEAQLDNLADEMKRVDELSQELGRISDESEANVQVLSAEASSLAQKVEDLTAKTQQMKEREVELLAKAQMADECQAEFKQLKEAKAELQAKLARAEQAESQLARLSEAQVELGNRLKQAEEFEKQCEHLKELASKVPQLEKKSAQLKEAQERVVVLEEKCALLAEECAVLEKAQSKVSQLEKECQELRELRDRYADLKKERDDLSEENSTLSKLKEECSMLRTENEKIANECIVLREAKAVSAEECKMRSDDLVEQVKKSSNLEDEVEKLRRENEELEKLRLDYVNLSGVEEKLKQAEEECDRLRNANQRLDLAAVEKNGSRDEQDNVRDDELLKSKRSLERVEVECEDLREQLKAAKAEIDELRSDLEFVKSVPAGKPLSPAKDQRISSLVSGLEDGNSNLMPVVEEPIVVKKVKDLYKTREGSEDDDDDDEEEEEEEESKTKQNWKEAYETLLEEHKTSIDSNQQIIEDLKKQLKLREEKPRRKPWERKEQENTHIASLESKALGAEGNSVSSVERLQNQLAGLQSQLKDSKQQHRQEVSELRRMLLNNSHGTHGPCTLEDATELEYLRNILYEYMMGKEPMVLARVIAAVVKFDSDQTKKILQKEEQRMTLLGQLGIS